MIVPTYKMDQAAREQDAEPVAQREPLWDEEKDDAPAAKSLRLYLLYFLSHFS